MTQEEFAETFALAQCLPGPSASQARKMDNKSNSNDIGLCRMCLGSFKRGTHKKKDCKKHHRYSNLLAR